MEVLMQSYDIWLYRHKHGFIGVFTDIKIVHDMHDIYVTTIKEIYVNIYIIYISLNDGLNMLPLDSFMSYLDSLLGYSIVEYFSLVLIMFLHMYLHISKCLTIW